MTGRPAVLASQIEEVQDYLHRQVKGALHAHSDAVRIVTEIGLWVRTQEHLLSLCREPDCADCRTRRSLLDSLGSLLPKSLERRAGHGGEDGDARHQSDPARPGAVEHSP